MFEHQTKITQKFKNLKKSLNNIDGIKRKIEIESNEKELDLESCLKNNKRIKIDSDISFHNQKVSNKPIGISQNPEDLASKSTVWSINETEPQSSSLKAGDLSSKTKNIIYEILQKKKKKEKPFSKLMQTKILFGQDNSVRFSVDNSLGDISNKKRTSKESNNVTNSQEKPPELSSKAKEIIEKLKEERKNRFLREKEKDKNRQLSRSESSFSLRFKYEELIQKTRELPLPPKYKSLFNSFVALDQVINLNKIKAYQQITTIDFLKQSIESSTHRQFNLKTFQQILYIVPHFYIYKYEKIRTIDSSGNNINDYQLVIDIPDDFSVRAHTIYPSDFDFTAVQMPKGIFNSISSPISQSDSNKRKSIFKNILYEIVNGYHNKFIEKEKIKNTFDPYKTKTWHHKFDLNTMCEDIPLYGIVSKPSKAQVFEKVILENDIKSQIMKDAMSLTSDEDKSGNEENPIRENELSKYVSFDFIKRIKAKEEAIKLSKEINEHILHVHSTKNYQEIYQEMLKQMKTFFYISSTGSFELGDISEKVLNSSMAIKDALNTQEKVGKIILKISKNYPQLVQVKNHSLLGLVVLMNLNIPIPNEIKID